MNERKPVYQNKRPKEEKQTRLVINPTDYLPPTVRTLRSLRIDLPGAFNIRADSSFQVQKRNFIPGGPGTSLTPIDKRPAKKNGHKP